MGEIQAFGFRDGAADTVFVDGVRLRVFPISEGLILGLVGAMFGIPGGVYYANPALKSMMRGSVFHFVSGFLASPTCLLICLAIFSRRNCENQSFWPPKPQIFGAMVFKIEFDRF